MAIIQCRAIVIMAFVCCQCHLIRAEEVTLKPKLVRYTSTETQLLNGKHVSVMTSTVYSDLNLAHVRKETQHFTDSGIVLITSIQHGLNRKSLLLNSLTCVATLGESPLPSSETARTILELVRQLQDDDQTQRTEEELNGVACIKLARDFSSSSYRTTVWLDVTHRLPTRLVVELYDSMSKAITFRMTDTSYEWNPRIENADTLFLTTPPDGYTLQDRTAVGDYPENVESLKTAERRTMRVVAAGLAATVRIGDGTGVIIEEDGLILSQWHVSHTGTVSEPGQTVAVTMHDGETRRAILLGGDLTNDLSLLKLVDAGPYQYASLARSPIKLGDVVINIGHPNSEDVIGRGAVARLGRVVCCDEQSLAHGVFMADCYITGGDSGGPLFDQHGTLIAIVRSSALTGVFPPNSPAALQLHPRPMAYTTCDQIRKSLAAMLKGLVLPLSNADQAQSYQALASATQLPIDCWTQGRTTKKAFAGAIQKAHKSVVQVRNGSGESTSLGVVVSDGNWVLTPSERLPFKPSCYFHDGRLIRADVWCVSDEH